MGKVGESKASENEALGAEKGGTDETGAGTDQPGTKDEAPAEKKRRGIVLCSKVEEIGVDGEMNSRDLQDGEKEKVIDLLID